MELVVYMYRDPEYNHRAVYSILVRVGIFFGADKLDQEHGEGVPRESIVAANQE